MAATLQVEQTSVLIVEVTHAQLAVEANDVARVAHHRLYILLADWLNLRFCYIVPCCGHRGLFCSRRTMIALSRFPIVNAVSSITLYNPISTPTSFGRVSSDNGLLFGQTRCSTLELRAAHKCHLRHGQLLDNSSTSGGVRYCSLHQRGFRCWNGLTQCLVQLQHLHVICFNILTTERLSNIRKWQQTEKSKSPTF